MGQNDPFIGEYKTEVFNRSTFFMLSKFDNSVADTEVMYYTVAGVNIVVNFSNGYKITVYNNYNESYYIDETCNICGMDFQLTLDNIVDAAFTLNNVG